MRIYFRHRQDVGPGLTDQKPGPGLPATAVMLAGQGYIREVSDSPASLLTGCDVGATDQTVSQHYQVGRKGCLGQTAGSPQGLSGKNFQTIPEDFPLFFRLLE